MSVRAQKHYRHINIYIYMYTHHESLVYNHELASLAIMALYCTSPLSPPPPPPPHTHTHTNTPTGQVIEEDGLQENSERVGDVLLRGMLSLREEFDMVGDVRGKGLMLGMEMVKNRVSCKTLYSYTCIYMFKITTLLLIVLMRDEKEERKKQAKSNKQQGKATQHTQGSHFS